MDKRTVLYTTNEERNIALAEARVIGETMLHDDFGVGPLGENQLTFDIVIDIIIPPTAGQIRQKVLEDKARNDQQMSVAELREMYKLRFLT